MPERMAVSVVLPTYNEKENIEVLVPEVHRVLRGREHEIIVVDDRSPDGTADAVRALESAVPGLRLVLKDREGLGAALRRGYDEARHEAIVSMDSDLSFNPADIPTLLGRLEEGCDLVLGCRHAGGGAYEKPDFGIAVKYAVSRIGNIVVRSLTGLPVRDYSANFRAIRRAAWHSLQPAETSNSLLLEMILKASVKSYRICEVPVTFSARRHGRSKLNLWIEVPRYLLRLGRHFAAYRLGL